MSSDISLQAAIDAFEQGDSTLAFDIFQQVLIAQPHNPLVRLEFSNMLMRDKRFDDARDMLNSMTDEDKTNPAVLALYGQLDAIEIVINAPAFDALISAVEQEPNNCLAREQLAAHFILRGDYKAAMEQYLTIVQTDNQHNEDAGRTGLLKIFDTLGQSHELVEQYRRKLAQLLN